MSDSSLNLKTVFRPQAPQQEFLPCCRTFTVRFGMGWEDFSLPSVKKKQDAEKKRF
jgi:hypothetical protein